MAAEAARVLDYYDYGSAVATKTAPKGMVLEPASDETTKRMDLPQPQNQMRAKEALQRRERERKAAVKRAPRISAFAVLGSLFISVLMVFVVLAQISYNEAAGETVRLNTQLIELTERNKALALTFESVIDMKEVERFARDELGMSKPDGGQVIIFKSTPRDRAIVISSVEEQNTQGFGTFIRSLTDYFKR